MTVRPRVSTGPDVAVVAGAGYLVVEWSAVPVRAEPSALVSAEAILFADGAVVLQYQSASAQLGRLGRGPSVIMPLPFSFIWRIPIRGTNRSDE